MSTIHVEATNIKWDVSNYTGSEDDLREFSPDMLPSSIDDIEIDCYEIGDDLSEIIIEYLYDNYGYDVKGFNFNVI